MSWRRSVIASVALAIAVTTCSVPTDEAADEINPTQLPESLRPGFTTTTTTTMPTPETEAATVYLLHTPPETQLRLVAAVEREVRRGASLEEILATLFGPEAVATEEERAQGYSNTLFDFALLSAEVEGDVAVVNIVPLTPEGEPSSEPYAGDLVPPAAQIVYSATARNPERGVRILFNGQEAEIPTVAGDSELGAVLHRSDYARFDPENPENTTTTAPAEEAGAAPSDTDDG